MKDYYKVLELEFDVEISAIKKSYRRLALRYHPDRNKAHDASQRFIEITEAYEVLNNETKKNIYDNLHLIYFQNQKQQKKQNECSSSKKTKEWETHGKKKAEEYASMNYDDFIDRIVDELKLGVSYIPNIIFILISAIGILSSFFVITEINASFGLLMLIMYGTACYFLYERAKKDYIAERRHKILNKYK